MTLTLDTEHFKSALSNVGRAVASKPILPVLSTVLFQKQGSELKLTATNLEIFISESLTVNSDDPDFKIAVPAEKLSSFVSKLKTDEISMTFDNEKAVFKSKGVKTSVATMSADDFPNKPNQFDYETYFENIDDFLLAIKSAPFFNESSTAGILSSVNIKNTGDKLTGEKLTFVATEGYRLSRYQLETDKQMQEVNIPGFAVKQLVAALNNQAGSDLTIRQSNGYIEFKSDKVEVSTRVIAGNYPPVDRIIRTSSTGNISFDLKTLIDAIELGLPFADPQTHAVKLTVSPAFIFVSFRSQNGDYQHEETGYDRLGEFDESLLGMEITFNSVYFLSVLKRAATFGKTGIMRFIDKTSTEGKPVMIESLENDSYISMLQAIKI